MKSVVLIAVCLCILVNASKLPKETDYGNVNEREIGIETALVETSPYVIISKTIHFPKVTKASEFF